MLKFEIVTLFPEVFNYLECGVIGRALRKGLFTLRFWNPRDYTTDNYHKVDDSPYGGGGSLVMLLEPLHQAICAAKAASPLAKLIYLTPQGKLLNQRYLEKILGAEGVDSNYILVSGRYEGFDERIFAEHPGLEISIGDYVLSGGELPVMVLIEALVRQIPGVLGSDNSRKQESFQNKYLDYPQYTKPRKWRGFSVPDLLYSGKQAKIDQWRRKQSLKKTWEKRPDLLVKEPLSEEERNWLLEDLENVK